LIAIAVVHTNQLPNYRVASPGQQIAVIRDILIQNGVKSIASSGMFTAYFLRQPDLDSGTSGQVDGALGPDLPGQEENEAQKHGIVIPSHGQTSFLLSSNESNWRASWCLR
jgi:hypothetical protein